LWPGLLGIFANEAPPRASTDQKGTPSENGALLNNNDILRTCQREEAGTDISLPAPVDDLKGCAGVGGNFFWKNG
jgi:hypothetical protein